MEYIDKGCFPIFIPRYFIFSLAIVNGEYASHVRGLVDNKGRFSHLE